MALHKIRKHSIKGCLLVQFKYIENEGDFTTSSSSFVAVAGKNITMTLYSMLIVLLKQVLLFQ